MQKTRMVLTALLLTLASVAPAQWLPRQVGLRYSEQVSNSPSGNCGCFTMQGVAADLFWNLGPSIHGVGMGLAFNTGVENTRSIHNAGYGLTLSTFSAGPRFKLPIGKTQTFAQALFGLAHGSGTNFPQGVGTLIHSANSFALDIGAGADYPLSRRLSMRLLQVDYLRTELPNNTNNWQNHLLISTGLTLHL